MTRTAAVLAAVAASSTVLMVPQASATATPQQLTSNAMATGFYIADNVGAPGPNVISVGLGCWSACSGAAGGSAFSGVAADGSPSLTVLPENPGLSQYGYEIAYRTSNTTLAVGGSAASGDTTLPMMAATDPSIDAVGTNGYEVAYQTNNGTLGLYGTVTSGDTGLPMAPNTSPAIAETTNGGSTGYEVAYQTSTGLLAIYGTVGTLVTTDPMHGGTSPAITGIRRGAFEVAFENNLGHLATYGTADLVGSGGTGSADTVDTGQPMLFANGFDVTPSITSLPVTPSTPIGSFQIAYVNGNFLGGALATYGTLGNEVIPSTAFANFNYFPVYSPGVSIAGVILPSSLTGTTNQIPGYQISFATHAGPANTVIQTQGWNVLGYSGNADLHSSSFATGAAPNDISLGAF